ncbi:arsenic transporter [Paenibacillus albicereus]|uniref:Arsenic transporter n=2 Tax=Paenibacillus albicereus TaxID=2726185 RepID=A0A6H2GWA1_9BACL|nr:arsenic transporter [Paenibacillus albicereus]
MTAAIGIFIFTLILVIWQPRGLGIGWSASAGALLALALGVVSLHDVAAVTGIVWNATLAFVGIILISLVLDEIGFFEWCALHMARLAGGSRLLLFLAVILLGAAVSGLFANDGAALIMTPIVLAMVRALGGGGRFVLAFVMASGFIADTASLPLVISNLVNIVTADVFGLSFGEYASRMIVPTLVSIGASLLVLGAFYRKDVRGRYRTEEVRAPADAIRDLRLFRLSWYVMGALLAAYFASDLLELPVSLVTGAAALALLGAARRSPAVSIGKVVRGAPWSVVVFSIGMYVVVYGLRGAGLTGALGDALAAAAEHGLLAATMATGIAAALLSSVMNNMPTVMIDALAIQESGVSGPIREAMIYANVIGCNLGPKMTPIGSLATLLWLHVLAGKGVRISWGYYIRAGILLTVPTLLLALFGLYAWLLFLSGGWLSAGLATAIVLVAALGAGWTAFALLRRMRSASEREASIDA